MLEAHIAFEVAAWTDELTDTLGTHAETVFTWLDNVSLGSVFSEADLDALIAEAPIPDLATSLLAAHQVAFDDQTPLGELMAREDYDRVAATLAGMTDLHEAIVEQITTSDVYADLISHVLFSGIQSYVMADSPIAKRVPGAASLMRLGQNALDTAAPRLSKGIERQLTAFVAANLQDSLRESRQYLTDVIDEQALIEVADELWERNATSTVAEIAALIPEEALTEVLAAGQNTLAQVLNSATLRAMLQAVLDENAGRSVGELLAEAGITPHMVVNHVRPWILRAADDGVLEELVRERLTAFYATYE